MPSSDQTSLSENDQSFVETMRRRRVTLYNTQFSCGLRVVSLPWTIASRNGHEFLKESRYFKYKHNGNMPMKNVSKESLVWESSDSYLKDGIKINKYIVYFEYESTNHIESR